MPDPRRKISLRLLPNLIAAGRDWAEGAGSSLTGLIEDALRERLSVPPESTTASLDLGHRVENLERLGEREGAS